MDFSISTAEHLVRVGQRDQQGGTAGEEGEDQAGLENAMNSVPGVNLLLGAASMKLRAAALKDMQPSGDLEMTVVKKSRENVHKSTNQVCWEFSDPLNYYRRTQGSRPRLKFRLKFWIAV